jgi:anti-sigma B factor antagonist
MPGLVLKTSLVQEDTSVIHATGELDFATRDELVETLTAVEELGTRALILDLRGLSFIDSAGLHVLIAAHKRALAGGWQFQIVCGPGQVWRALTLSGLTTELQFVSRIPGEA